MSGDWGTSHYRRRVASELGVTVEALDRGLGELARQERSGAEYQSHSHSDRLKAFATVLGVPLVRLAGVDGVSSLLPDRPIAAKKKSRRPPANKKPGAKRVRGAAGSAARPKRSTVPLKTYPWETGSASMPPSVRAERPPPEICGSCFLPLNPLNGSCACT